jgi:C4-dicarboxylate-specific signal transduction histidine kinase
VERLLGTDRTCALAAATAHEFNDELTVILSSVEASFLAMEPGHPARRPLIDLECAALRCASTSSRLLNFSARRGTQPARMSLDAVLTD